MFMHIRLIMMCTNKVYLLTYLCFRTTFIDDRMLCMKPAGRYIAAGALCQMQHRFINTEHDYCHVPLN